MTAQEVADLAGISRGLLQRIEKGTHQREAIEAHWEMVCDEANLSVVDRKLFWSRQFLNPFAFEGSHAVNYYRLICKRRTQYQRPPSS